MNYDRGDLVLVWFPHSDLKTVKRRPALVVQADGLGTGLPQIVLAMITSNLARLGHPSRVLEPLGAVEAAVAVGVHAAAQQAVERVILVFDPLLFDVARVPELDGGQAVGGKFADAVLGVFGTGAAQYVVAVEGKGPTDPLDRPFKSRSLSAVDQGYRYAINLPCDWIVVTSMRQTRLYYKGADQQTYERFLIGELAENLPPTAERSHPGR